MNLACLILTVAVGAAGVDETISLPTDVSGYARGVDAVVFDPAAPALADGFELQLRSRLARDNFNFGRVGVFGVWSTPSLTPFVGFEWRSLQGQEHRRGTLGLAGSIGDLAIGIAFRRYFANDRGVDGVQAVDLGLAAEPFSWLTFALGVDSINSPRFAGARRKPALRFGVGVRPVAGAPFLTLGGDMSWQAEPYELVRSRLLLDIGFEGVHAVASYEPQVGRVWLTLAFSLLGSELRAAAVPPGFEDGEDGWGDVAMSLTARYPPAESLVWPSARTIEVGVSGALRGPPGGLFERGPAVSTLAYELDRVASDDTIAVVVLHIGRIEAGLASIDELRAAVARLREHGKTVVARMASADDKAYLVACAANEIQLDPSSTLRLDGFAVTVRYFADALAKLGIRFETVEIGRFKSAADPLTRSAPRPEDLEVRAAVVAQAMDLLRGALATDRGLGEASIEQILAQGVFTAEEALTAGLVDELSQPTDPAALPIAQVPGQPLGAFERSSRRWSRLPTVAVVPVVGTIVMQSGDNPLPGASASGPAVVAALEEAMRDTNVVAVVVRLESGGGDVYASELMWRAVRRLAEVKPVVISMGDVAASGAYYLAVGAPTIYADANTITGSIGIFTVKPDLSGLLDHVGIRSHTYKEKDHSDWSSWSRPLSPTERQQLERVLEHAYDDFVARVALGRGLSEEEVRGLAEGRVYTGQRALSLKLVDRIGGLPAAIRDAAARAGLAAGDEYAVHFPVRPLSLAGLARSMMAEQPTLLDAWAELLEQVRAVGGLPLAMMPVQFEVGP